MKRSRTGEVHQCSFQVSVIDSLYPVAPNAKFSTRFFRSIRGWCIIDPKNRMSKEYFRNKSTMLAEQKRHARSPHRFVIHPFSKMNGVLRMLFFIAWLWEYFTVSLIYLFPHHYSDRFHVLMIIMNFFQFIVWASFFFLGYVDEKERKIVIEPKKIVCHYLRTYFICDFVIVFHKSFFWHMTNKGNLLFNSYACNYGITVMATITCFARYGYFLSILRNITKRIHSSNVVYKLFYHIIVLGIIIHNFTCTLFSMPRLVNGDNLPAESWMSQARIHKMSKVYFMKIYPESLVIVVCFFFGASYDRYDFAQPVDQIVLAVISLFGRLYTLYMIADFLRVFGLVGVSESKYEQYLGQLEDYMLSKNLPDDLRDRLLKYYEYKLQKHYFNEGQIFTTLSETLRTELFLFGARKLIDKAEILKSLPKTALGILFATMKSETFVQMDIITKAGGKVENVYFISAGTVAVIDAQDIEVNHLGDGEEFGFLVTPEGKQLYTHVAVESSEIYYMRISTLLEFLETYPEVFRYFESRVKKKIQRYSRTQREYSMGGNDVISSLRAGTILEKQCIRDVDFDLH